LSRAPGLFSSGFCKISAAGRPRGARGWPRASPRAAACPPSRTQPGIEAPRTYRPDGNVHIRRATGRLPAPPPSLDPPTAHRRRGVRAFASKARALLADLLEQLGEHGLGLARMLDRLGLLGIDRLAGRDQHDHAHRIVRGALDAVDAFL